MGLRLQFFVFRVFGARGGRYGLASWAEALVVRPLYKEAWVQWSLDGWFEWQHF